MLDYHTGIKWIDNLITGVGFADNCHAGGWFISELG
jgi:hypothetical protein